MTPTGIWSMAKAKKRPNKWRSPRGRGRPTTYCKKTAEAVCERFADGETIRQISADEDMPSWGAIQGWLIRHKEFREAYTAARSIHADFEFERLRGIVDQVLSGDITPDVGRVVMNEINWILGRMKPRVYGDYKQIDATVQAEVHVKRIRLVDEREMNDNQRRIAEKGASLKAKRNNKSSP